MNILRTFSILFNCKISLICMYLFASLCSYPAHATPVKINFTGEIVSTTYFRDDPFSGVLSIGDAFSGFYIFDSDALNIANADQGRYRHRTDPYQFSIQFDTLGGVSKAADNDFNIIVSNDYFGVDAYDVQARQLSIGGVDADLAQIYLRDLTATALDSVALLDSSTNLSDYQERLLFLGATTDTGSNWGNISGRITSLSRVPEPATFFLICLGLVYIGFRKRTSVAKQA